MKHFIRRIILGTVLTGLLASSAWAQGRIATVDLGKVFEGYYKTKLGFNMLKDLKDEKEKELKSMDEERLKAKKEYDRLLMDANDPAISAEERDRRKRSAEEKFKYMREQEDLMMR